MKPTASGRRPFHRTGPTVYFFRQGREANGPIKIGYTTHVKRRYHEVFSHYRILIRILATIPGDEALEKKLHMALVGYECEMPSVTRSDGNTEFFRCPELESWATKLHTDDALIAALPTMTVEEIKCSVLGLRPPLHTNLDMPTL